MSTSLEEIFCSENVLPDLFYFVEFTGDIFRPLPRCLDAPSIHSKARDLFENLVIQLSDTEKESGRILLLLGGNGSGKTHLMRAFRSITHEFDYGFFAYMQATQSAQRLDLYVLKKVIESLEQPLLPPRKTETALQRFSMALARQLPKEVVSALQEAESGESVGVLVNKAADQLVDKLNSPDLHFDIIRALLYLQCGVPSVRSKVSKYLRMEELSDYEQEVLGGITPLDADGDAIEIIRQLAKITRTLLGRTFVVCFDQIEVLLQRGQAIETVLLNRMLELARELGEIPGVVVVLGFHQSTYNVYRSQIVPAILDRIELSPPKQFLEVTRTEDEAKQVIGRRLRYLFDEANVPYVYKNESIDPIPPKVFDSFSFDSTRELLRDAYRYRKECIKAGCILKSWPLTTPSVSDEPEDEEVKTTQELVSKLVNDWESYATSSEFQVPDSDNELLSILLEALIQCSLELGGSENSIQVTQCNSSLPSIRLNFNGIEGEQSPLVIAICNATTRGGAFTRQLRLAREMVRDNQKLVIVRSSPFPSGRVNHATQELAQIIANEGRRTVVQDSDWRKMVALSSFKADKDRSVLEAFLRRQRPISNLECIRDILEYENLKFSKAQDTSDGLGNKTHNANSPNDSLVDVKQSPDASPGTDDPPQKAQEQTQQQQGSSVSVRDSNSIEIGTMLMSRRAEPALISPQHFKTHATFIGATGSGKTTLALQIIEQLLERGLPAILIDRKGDLAGYRKPGIWGQSLEDGRLDSFRDRLAQKVDVAVYTPGHPEGCSLNLPLLPQNRGDLSEFDRQQAARASTEALTGMMNYGSGQKAQGKGAVLQRALQRLVEEEDPVTAYDVLEYVKLQEPDFIADLGPLAKFAGELALDLEILLSQKQHLLDSGEDNLDAGVLFGRDASSSGRTRLSIICTKFLSESEEFFWISQLMLEIYRWGAKNPSDLLQATVFIDEADKYLPAIRQPATKQPIENLLRRARSMGIGILLATQNPGDFDYRARDNILTWFVGNLSQRTGVEKIKELFSNAGTDVSSLAGQSRGQFHWLRERQVRKIQAHRNAVKLPSQVPEDEILRLAAEGLQTASKLR